jgi:hypothetical protein
MRADASTIMTSARSGRIIWPDIAFSQMVPPLVLASADPENRIPLFGPMLYGV